MYEDDVTDAEGVLAGDNEEDENPILETGFDCEVPIPEVNNNDVNNSVMLSRGNTYARGKFIGWKRDADGNFFGIRNDNPILDTHEYLVEFVDGDISKLTETFIAESMYAECDDSGNEYSIMDLIVDNHNNDKAITVLD